MRLRRSIFIVVDAGRAPSGDWVQTVEGPSGTELVMAAADTAVRCERARELHRVREHHGGLAAASSSAGAAGCRPSSASSYGAPPNWNCRDLKFFVNRVAFDQLGPERAKALNAVRSRFKLPAEQVDALIEAGGDALRANPVFRSS